MTKRPDFELHQPLSQLDKLRDEGVSFETRLYLLLEHLATVDPDSAVCLDSYREGLQRSVTEVGGLGARHSETDGWTGDPEEVMASAMDYLQRERDSILGRQESSGRWAETACQALSQIPSHRRPLGWLSLLAQGHALLGNAHRVRGDLEKASDEMFVAQLLLRKERENTPTARIEFDDFSGALRRDERRYHAAVWHFERAIVTAEAVGKMDLAARALIGLGIVHGYWGQFRVAIEVTREGLERLASDLPQLELLSRMNLALFAASDGDLKSAQVALEQARVLLATVDDHATQLRFSWIEARLRSAEGETDLASPLYRETLEGFKKLDRPYDVLLVTLDYALSLRLQPDRVAIQELASEVRPYLVRAPVARSIVREILRILDTGIEESSDFALLTSFKVGSQNPLDES